MQDSVITPHEDYLRLGGSDETYCERYRNLFKAHLDPEMAANIRLATQTHA